MKVALLTSETAEPLVRETLGNYSGGLELDVVALPVPVISILSTKAIAAIVASRPDIARRLGGADLIILPGTVSGDADEVTKVAGRPARKGPKTLGALPAVLKYVEAGVGLDPRRSAEEVLGAVRPQLAFEEAFRVGGVAVPRRGPPLVLLAEVGPEVPPGQVRRRAERMVGDGADIIVVGLTPSTPPGEAASRVREALAAGRPVIAEAPTPELAEEALAAGAEGLMGSPGVLREAAERAGRGLVLVASSRRLDELEAFEREESARHKVMVDPVLDMPPLGMVESLARFREAASRLRSPLLFPAANATEDVEADTGGVHAVLALAAVELRASAYLVVEETYKSYRATAEAREAIRLAEEAFAGRTTERGMFSRLLVLKEQYPPPSESADGAEEVGYVEPIMRPGEYARIFVDHERGELAVTYFRGGRPVASLRGRHALSLARELVRRLGVDAEHAAYIGYELAKAEVALRLGKAYVQDEPVIVAPWERNGNGVRG